MTIETKAREWAEKEAKQFSEDAYALPVYKVNELVERAYLAGAAGAMEWVPVSERLPERGQEVLVSEFGKIGVCCYDRFYKDKELTFGDEQSDCHYIPTHWMPLPPHPEKEQL